MNKTRWARRGKGIAGWILPGAMWTLVPKCPACLAAYVAAWTGLGLTLTTAAYLRAALLAVCAGCLLYLAMRRLRRLFAADNQTEFVWINQKETKGNGKRKQAHARASAAPIAGF